MVALIPFILSIMGFGFAPKVLVVFLFAVFPILYNTVEGARSIKPELIEVAQSFRSSEWELWRDVLVPYTLPFALTGIRQAVGRGLVGMVAAELFLSSSGMGQLIMRAARTSTFRRLYGSILVVTILGVCADVGRPRAGKSFRGLAGAQPMTALARRNRNAATVSCVRSPSSDVALRVVAGIVILLLWEDRGARLWAPPFVARPSGIIAAFPR